MSEKFSRSVLRVVAAQLSQAVGFDSIHSSALDILTNVAERYLLVLGKTVHDFSEQCGQTHPNLSDVEFSLRQLRIPMPDLIEYMQQMEPVVFPHKVSKFPAPKSSNLQFPSGNDPKDFERDEHVPCYMPSMLMAPNPSELKEEGKEASTVENQPGKAANFVIAGKQDSSSDEDDYCAGDMSNEEYMSDDSLAHNPIKSRHLTKPEDIPTVEGTAPSSMMSVPSSADLDELRGSVSPTRHLHFDSDNIPDIGLKKGKRPIPPMRRPSQASDDVPWLSTDQEKSHDTNTRQDFWPSQKKSEDPKWLSSKKSHDKYDADWLQDDAASPVHLTKPPTPDGSFESPKESKQPWYDDDHSLSPTGSANSKSSSKKIAKASYGSQSEMKSKSSVKSSPSLPYSGQRHSVKSHSERKSSHHKLYKPGYKNSPGSKKLDGSDKPIKARIEAAEKLIHSPPIPPYIPSSPKSTKHRMSVQSLSKSPVRSSIEKAEKLLKHPPVENLNFPSSRESSPAPGRSEKIDKRKEEKHQDRLSNFASSKSMYDAIDAVINRVSEEALKEDEEARKEAEEAELMKFSHLVKDSSSSDSEPDVSHKVEQMLQLEERGLREARPPTPGSSPLHPATPSSSVKTPQSYVIDEEEDGDVVVDSDDNQESFISSRTPSPKKPVKSHDSTPKFYHDKHSKKEKHKKHKSQKISAGSEEISTKSSHKLSSKLKKEKNSPKPSSFVTTETISEKSVKMKVKLKKKFVHEEPKLFDVAMDRDRIRITEGKHSSKYGKEDRHKSKEEKHHKSKEHKKHLSLKSSSEIKTGSHDLSVEKIILKKSKSGDAKVVKPKIKEHARSPSPIASRSNLPLPKLSAAVPVLSVTAVSKEKDKKKSKKEKKKKRDKDKERSYEKERSHDRERHHEKQRSMSKEGSRESDKSRMKEDRVKKPSKDLDISSPMVPKLTLKMGADEKKFIIKPSGGSGKSAGKKRSHSFVADSPIPAKERKISVESIKQEYEQPPAVERKVITQTISAGPVGVYEDEEGNKVWICPGCNKPDDGSPMIGCDTCDDWYHWPCVSITREPPDDEDWYCPRCRKRRQMEAKGKSSSKKRKKK